MDDWKDLAEEILTSDRITLNGGRFVVSPFRDRECLTRLGLASVLSVECHAGLGACRL